MKLPKCCESTISRDGADMPGAECERKKGHKGKHRERWYGRSMNNKGALKSYEIVVRWR